MSIFNQVSKPKVKSSNFNLSEEMKLSCNIGDLIPICCKEVLPSDKISISTELLVKFAPLAAPVMHRIKAYVHYFFVPMYQISDSFEKFINPKLQPELHQLPFINPSTASDEDIAGEDWLVKGSLADYLGLPILNTDWKASGDTDFSVLPFLAYQHIFNSFYRNQNTLPDGDSWLCDIEELKKEGVDFNDLDETSLRSIFQLRKRAWAKDYFTSALPSPQAGDDVLIPITSEVQADGTLSVSPSADEAYNLQVDDEGNLIDPDSEDKVSYVGGLKAVNTTATINDLRKSIALQKFKELAERGGTRYSEIVSNFFNAYLPDWYVNRPIYLGGNSQPITIGEVVQTSQTTAGAGASAQGTRAGIASSHGFSKSAFLKAPCHGFLMGILSIRPEATYQQGLERMWTRHTLYDYPFPQFANLGEQEIYQQEIFAQGDPDEDNIVFGYTPRYAEWKEGHTHVCGDFRDTLAYWHFGRIFDVPPTLSEEFTNMETVRTDPFVVTDASQTDHVYVNLYNHISARRPLPYFGTPGIL